MKTKKTRAAKLDEFYVYLYAKRKSIRTDRIAKKRIRLIHGGYNGSQQEFNSVVKAYWKKYGVKAKKYWYDIYCQSDGHYDPRYIPDTIWSEKILPYYNDLILRRAYTDKCFLDRILPCVAHPETVVKNVGGYFLDGEEKLISREQALALCKAEERLIFKPAIFSGGGHGIQFFEKNEMDPSVVDEYFDDFRINFIVQHIVQQHADLARINKNSLNTVRVLSFHFNNEIHILSTQLRMGADEAKVDNVTSGGCSCPIKEDGWLQEKAVTRKSEWSDRHPSGILFKDIHVPSYDKVISAAKKCHEMLPYFNLIGWDFAVREDGEPVLVEFNLMPDQNQVAGGPTFGDLTDEVLDEAYLKGSIVH